MRPRYPVHRRPVPGDIPLRALRRPALAAALALAASPMAASAQTTELEPVVVTASGIAQPLADAIPATTVYTRAELDDSSYMDLPGILAGEAGLDLVRNGGAGGLASVFMRGAEARHVLILVDGVRIESATSGTARLENLMLDQIDRIEIVRGNVSALYGSAAVGGVVQVFTRRGEGPPRGQVSLGIGSRGEERLALGSSGTFGPDGATDYSLQASRYRTRGESAIDHRILPTADPDRDGYRNTSLTGSLGHRLSSRHRIGARFYWSEAQAELDDSFMIGPGRVERQDSRLSIASAWWEARFTEGWRSLLSASVTDDRSRTHYLGGTQDPFDTRRNELEWKNELQLGPGTLSLGVATVHERIATSVTYDRESRHSESVSVAYAFGLGPHHAEFALRYDDHSDVGDATTGSIGYSYAFSSRWKALGRVATAFTAPSFNYLFYPGFSNPDLDPERARSVELGLQYQHDGTLLRATAFRTRYTDLIDAPPPTFLPANVARAQVQGLELAADTRLAGWRIAANATFQSPVNRATGETLRRRARYLGAIDVSRRTGAWELGADLAWNGSRHDLHIQTFGPVRLDHRAVLGLRAERRLGRDTSVVLRLANVTDDDTPTAHGYITPGRSVSVMLRWQPS